MRWCSISQTRELLSLYCSPWDSCHMWGSRDGGSWLGRSASPRGTWTLWIRALSIPSSWGKVTNRARSYWQRHLKQQCYKHGEAQSAHLPLLQPRARFCGAHRSKPPRGAPRGAREERQPPLPVPSLGRLRSSAGRHRPAGCTRAVLSSEHIHGELRAPRRCLTPRMRCYVWKRP